MKLANGQTLLREELASNLVRLGNEVTVYVPGAKGSKGYDATISGGGPAGNRDGGYWHQVSFGSHTESVYVPSHEAPGGHSELTQNEIAQRAYEEAEAAGRLPPDFTGEESDGFNPKTGGFDWDAAGQFTGTGGLYPILLDINGDGEIALSSFGASTAYFDVDNDGYDEQATWIGVDDDTGAVEDGFLVADLNGDGNIVAAELAFAYQTADPTDTDLEAFATLFDSNDDGVVDSLDADWQSLNVWLDSDRDGQVDVGELSTLADSGIVSIDVDLQEGSWVPVDEMTDAELAGFGISRGDIGFVSTPGVEDRLAGILPDGAVLFGITRYTANGGTQIAADIGLLYNQDGFQTQTDTEGNLEIRAETGSVIFEINDANGAAVNLSTAGYDAVYGGEGNDTISAGYSDGHYGSVIITGGSGADRLTGSAGTDLIAGDAGNDTLIGQDGDDILFVDADDLSSGYVDGGAGFDTVHVTRWQVGDPGVLLTLSDLSVEAVVGTDGNDSISTGTTQLDNDGSSVGVSLFGRAGDDSLTGGAGGDMLSGEADNDTLLGGDGDDTMFAGVGSDSLVGGADNDMLDGGADNDVLVGASGKDTLALGLGDDTLTGGSDGDTFFYRPGSGDDTITDFQPGIDRLELSLTAEADVDIAADGADALITIQLSEGTDTIRLLGVNPAGLQADDILYGFVDGTDGSDTPLDGNAMANVIAGKDGDDVIVAGEGADRVLAGKGNDSISGGDSDDQIFGEGGDDTLRGDAGDDALEGGAGDDSIDGGIGEDLLVGAGGNDSIFGGDNQDGLFGGSGHDTLGGGEGDDAVDGGTGDDLVSGGAGEDALVGGRGADTLDGGTENDLISGGEGSDQLTGGAGDDALIGGLGNDTMTGGTGADVFRFATGDGDDVITDFEAGADRIDLWYVTSTNVSVTADGADVLVDTGDGTLRVQGASVAAVATALNYAQQTGTGSNDSLTGHDGVNLLVGGAGSDTLAGQGGDDAMSGGPGADSLNGGDGNDRLEPGSGNDTLTGGAGDDGFVFEANGGDNVIEDFVSGEDFLVFRGLSRDDLTVEPDPANSSNARIAFTGGSVVLVGVPSSAVAESDLVFAKTETSEWSNTWAGTLDSDSISGGYGDDRLYGDAGDDTLSGDQNDDLLFGESGADLLDGGSGNDGLAGGRGDDTLIGGEGSDQLTGGIGSDSLTGGEGSDVFVVSEGDGVDTITDFHGSEDRLSIQVDDPSTVSVSVGAGNTVVSYGSRGDQIILAGVALLDLLASGRVTISWAGNDYGEGHQGTDAADQVTAGEGNDTVRGESGDDVVDGGYGNDLLIGDELSSGSLPDHVITLEAWSPVNDPVDMWVRVNGAWVGSATVDADYGGAAQTVTFTVDGDVALDDLEIGISNASDLIVKSIEVSGRTVSHDYMTSTDLPWHYEDRYSEDLIAVNTATDVHFNIGPFGLRNDVLSGGGGNDTLHGNDGYDVLAGGNDDDVVEGGKGNDTLSGDAGEDTLDGGDGDDWIAGGEGDDTLTGGDGEDFFQVSFDSGDDIITDYEPGEDALYLGELGEGDVTITEETTGSWPNQQVKTIISYAGGSVTLEGVSKGDLGELDLLYHYAGATPIDDIAIGRQGADKIEALQGNDLVDGGAGNDTIHGEFDTGAEAKGSLLTIVASGEHFQGAPEMQVTLKNAQEGTRSNNYTTDITYAPIAVNEVFGTDEPGTYSFRLNKAADLSSIEIAFVNDAYGGSAETDRNLVIHDILVDGQPLSTAGVTSSLPSGWVDPGDGLFAKLFDDTETMTVNLSDAPKAGMNDTLSGGDGDDEIHGQGGSDYVLGGAGNDTLTGDAAGTVIVVEAHSRGYWSTVEVWVDGTKIDTLGLNESTNEYTIILDADIDGDSIKFVQTDIHYNDDYYQDGPGEPSVFQKRDFTNVAVIDNLSIDGQILRTLSIALGPSDIGSQTVPGFAKTFDMKDLALGFGEDTIDGGAGDDVLAGGALGDTFRFVGEHGSDIIEDFEVGIDTIELDLEDPSSLTVTNNGTDTTISHSNGSILVKGVTWSGVPSDGSLQVMKRGTGSDDTLSGETYGETFDAGAGDDVLTGGGGANIYRFQIGDGQDTITDFDVSKDSIDLGELTKSDYSVVQVGSDTEVRYGPGGDVVTLQGVSANSLRESTIDSADAAITGRNGPDMFDVQDGDGVTIIEGFQETVDIIRLATADSSSVSVTTGNGDTEISYGSSDTVVLKNVTLPNLLLDEKIQFVWLGGSGVDTRNGTADDDHHRGEGGADTLLGHAGADTLDGGEGHDSLEGMADGDSLVGDAGNDTLLGDRDYTEIVLDARSKSAYHGSTLQVRVDGALIETLYLTGSTQTYTVQVEGVVDAGSLELRQVDLRYSDQYYQDGQGEPSVWQYRDYHNNAWIDRLEVNGTVIVGNPTMMGWNRVTGSSQQVSSFSRDYSISNLAMTPGRDTLDGGEGNDLLTGGGLSDVYRFSGPHGNDTITDFETGLAPVDPDVPFHVIIVKAWRPHNTVDAPMRLYADGVLIAEETVSANYYYDEPDTLIYTVGGPAPINDLQFELLDTNSDLILDEVVVNGSNVQLSDKTNLVPDSYFTRYGSDLIAVNLTSYDVHFDVSAYSQIDAQVPAGESGDIYTGIGSDTIELQLSDPRSLTLVGGNRLEHSGGSITLEGVSWSGIPTDGSLVLTVVGTDGDDTIELSQHSELVKGGEGADTFDIDQAHRGGEDMISDFDVLEDYLNLDGLTPANYDLVQFGADTEIRFDSGGKLTLQNVSTSDLNGSNVSGMNTPPTAVLLDGNSVAENTSGASVGSVTVDDRDVGDSFTFAIDDDRFEIVGGTLKLKDGHHLDIETEESVLVAITATDSAGHSAVGTFELAVEDINDAPTGLLLDNASVDDNTAGAVVGSLTVIDPDQQDSHTYDVSDGRFEVAGGVLRLRDGVELDYSVETSVSLTVTATDAGGLAFAETFNIAVNDANAAPTSIVLNNASVDENADGAVIGALTVTDPDAGDTHSFSVDDSRFEVVSGQLKLKSGQALDYEVEATVPVTVTATDAGGLFANETVNISVVNANETPTAIVLDNSAVDENSDGAVIGTMTVTDPDVGDSHNFTVDDSRFEVVGGQLRLKAGEALDHEVDDAMSVVVTAADAGGLSTNQSFTISVSDANETPSAITLDNASVAENAAGAVVGALTVLDPDSGDSHSFAVDDARFEVVGGQLKLTDGEALDHEAAGTVSVMVTATDTGGLSTNETFDISVMGVNEAPTEIALDNASVAENSAGAVVGTLTVADPDVGDSHSFTVSDVRFEVIGDQLKLKAGEVLDHETAATVSVTVVATDGAGLSTEQTFEISVADTNEAPIGIALDNATIGENQSGEVVGTLTATDPDAGDGHSYTVDDARFEVVGGQLKLKSGETLDHEAASTVSVQVTATDTGGLATSQTFDISVTDANEQPMAISLDNASVTENTAGAVIGTLSVVDPDAGDSHSFTVDDARFEVVGGQLRLKADQALDHAAEPTVSITVSAVDSGGLSANETFVVSVTDTNGAPTSIALDNGSIDENVTGAVIGALTVTDPDAGDSHSFTVDDTRFEVVGGQLKLKAGEALDHEAAATVSVLVTATDTGGLATSETFDISVTDANEQPTAITLDNVSVSENVAGAIIGTPSVLDPDAGDSHSFTVDDARFEVVGGQLKLKAGEALDSAVESSVLVTLTATDVGGLLVSEVFSIAVTVEGSENHAFAEGDGVNYVSNFDPVAGVLQLTLDDPSTISVAVANGDTTVSYGSSDSVVLSGVELPNLGAEGRINLVLSGTDGPDEVYSLTGADTISGGQGDDGIVGDLQYLTGTTSGGDDYLTGGEGNDVLFGDTTWLMGSAQGGDDVLVGGEGNDILFGDSYFYNFFSQTDSGDRGGNDTLIGGDGDDLLTGGTGADVFRFGDASGSDTISDFEQGTDLIQFDQAGLEFSDLIITDQGDHRLVQNGANTVAVYGLQTGLALTAADILFQ
ncbi:MAG: carbohydrate-binding domain-containing protein [Pseudomonadota bacterium]